MPLPVHSGSVARARGRLGSGRLSGLRLWLQEGQARLLWWSETQNWPADCGRGWNRSTLLPTSRQRPAPRCPVQGTRGSGWVTSPAGPRPWAPSAPRSCSPPSATSRSRTSTGPYRTPGPSPLPAPRWRHVSEARQRRCGGRSPAEISPRQWRWEALSRSAPMEGRALFAANRALPWPAEPAAALWQACTLLREHRGDGHVAALAAAGIGGRGANVLQTAAGIVPREVFEAARHYDDAEWDRVSARLMDRGLVGPDGKLTARGKDVRNDVEDRTDRVALTAYDRLDDEPLLQLLDP